jgi:hypothetical protein
MLYAPAVVTSPFIVVAQGTYALTFVFNCTAQFKKLQKRAKQEKICAL